MMDVEWGVITVLWSCRLGRLRGKTTSVSHKDLSHFFLQRSILRGSCTNPRKISDLKAPPLNLVEPSFFYGVFIRRSSALSAKIGITELVKNDER
jgi:hypothetical protein